METVQYLKRQESDEFYMLMKYYSLLFTLNDLTLTEGDLQLITFTAIRGNLYAGGVKEDFCKRFDTSVNVIYNRINKLKNLGILYRENRRKLTLSKSLQIPLDKPITLIIKLSKKEEWTEEKMQNTTTSQSESI